MSYRKMYEAWLANDYFNEETRAELEAIAGDEKEIEDRFYQDLEFGTAGTPRSDRSRYEPYEHLYGKKSNSGACKLHFKGRRREARGSYCL